METPSTSLSDEYFAQDDTSEAIRHAKLSGIEITDEFADVVPEYDPNIHGEFDFDLSTRR